MEFLRSKHPTMAQVLEVVLGDIGNCTVLQAATHTADANNAGQRAQLPMQEAKHIRMACYVEQAVRQKVAYVCACQSTLNAV